MINCPNCNANNWENVDHARMKPAGMHVCNDCGYISYPDKWKSAEEIKEHYRESYRPPPSHFNIFAGERKNQFHLKFLNDLFTEWREKGITKPKIVEIGAAFGFTLQWIKQIFPEAEVYGTELTTSFRRNSFHEFGVRLDEDFDDSKKYDLIISYKVLEHQMEPQLELTRYQRALAPNGRLYISVPTWFDSLYNFGMGGFDLEYYYDPNHINVWTKNIFEGLLKRRGLEVVKSDYVIYSSTYLCKSNPALAGADPYKENPEDIKSNLTKIKAAFVAFADANYPEAMRLWPDYPQAHISNAEMSRKMLVEKGWPWFKENLVNKIIADCPNSADAFIMATDYAMRAEQWHEAIKYCEESLLMKPENPVSLHHMISIMREIAMRASDKKEKIHYFVQAREIARHLRNVSTQHFKEATDMIYLFNSKIPFEGETVTHPEPTERPLRKEEFDHARLEASL